MTALRELAQSEDKSQAELIREALKIYVNLVKRPKPTGIGRFGAVDPTFQFGLRNYSTQDTVPATSVSRLASEDAGRGAGRGTSHVGQAATSVRHPRRSGLVGALSCSWQVVLSSWLEDRYRSSRSCRALAPQTAT